MTASVLVRNANFSGALKTNSIYPSYNKLVGAKFFGNLIPDFRGFNKDKHFDLLTGNAAVTNYGVNCGAGECVSGLKSQAISTIAIAFNPSLLDSATSLILKSGAGSTTGTVSINCYPTNKVIKSSSYTTGSVNTKFGDNFFNEKLAVLVISYGTTAMSALLYDGQTFNSNHDTSSTANPQVADLDITVSGTEVYSVSVFNDEIDSNQKKDLANWLIKFYTNKVA